MGGGGGGSRSVVDLQELLRRAKEELQAEAGTGRRNVFISFASEDLGTVNMLRGQAKNEHSEIEFNDWSVREPFDSERAPYLKRKIGERIAQSSVTVVFLSEATATSRWVKWEIEESRRRGKPVVGVYEKGKKPAQFPEAIVRHKIVCVPWSRLAKTIEGLD